MRVSDEDHGAHNQDRPDANHGLVNSLDVYPRERVRENPHERVRENQRENGDDPNNHSERENENRDASQPWNGSVHESRWEAA